MVSGAFMGALHGITYHDIVSTQTDYSAKLFKNQTGSSIFFIRKIRKKTGPSPGGPC
jgi:hypothetical protein